MKKQLSILIITILVIVFGLSFFKGGSEVKNQTNPSSRQILESSPDDPVILAAGDIADCENLGPAKETAKLLEEIPGTILTLGDNSYPDGKKEEFVNCFDPTWGKFKSRIHPAVGNHEYHTENALPYFEYFGKAAGEVGKGYYSFNLGKWHIIAINSQLCDLSQCTFTSEQSVWLLKDLAANSSRCTLAYMHHPLSSSGANNYTAFVEPIWDILYEYNADVVLAGHDHDYERIAPQDSYSRKDAKKGIRSFVVGTGGGVLSNFSARRPAKNSEFKTNKYHGLLKLTLHANGFDWEFINTKKVIIDKGTGYCH